MAQHEFPGEVARPALAITLDERDLVSDGYVPAEHTDANLVNPWGVSYAPTGPFWVSDNGTGVTTLYDGEGVARAAGGFFAIAIATPPLDPDPATPTGQAFVGGQGFTVTAFGHSGDAAFLFGTEDGTIAGWAPTLDPAHAVLAVDHSPDGAVYKGLAVGSDGTQPLLFAANFASGQVEVYDHQFQQVNSFRDTSLPDTYAPFGIQVLEGKVFVTYAQREEGGADDVPGHGHGFVDEFAQDGTLLERVASHGPLNSPWGLAIAPDSFGPIAGDLLVGNFGDGTIDAYNLETRHFDGRLHSSDGSVLQIDGLWALIPGNGGVGGDPEKIYFTAGVGDEQHGLFGSLAVHQDQVFG